MKHQLRCALVNAVLLRKEVIPGDVYKEIGRLSQDYGRAWFFDYDLDRTEVIVNNLRIPLKVNAITGSR